MKNEITESEDTLLFMRETPALQEVGIGNSQQKHRLVVLLADVSNSMNVEAADGKTRIQALNAQLETWVPSVRREAASTLRTVEFAVITFGGDGARIISGDPSKPPDADGGAFVSAADFTMGPFDAGGLTPMVDAIGLGLQIAQDRQRYLRDRHRIHTGQPRVIMFSDGRPTDSDGHSTLAWMPLADQIRAMREQRRLFFLAFGVPGVDAEMMRKLVPDGGFNMLDAIDFQLLLSLILLATTADNPYTALQKRLHSSVR